ncbi:hypothetical protein [Arcanobacterium haemolyticum]|uniref:hypothetical protein n=1 Tax=Arcanobacterium haemolyticum TaxID=28264 RepID=UPI000D9FC403|nr:hypothetical protein [Arcanobacterium haemolyticum]SPT74659.1 FMN-dependent oxidoreductase, nitrilotriacetate monooxygenase family [Arcanobacterium haemolyticum]
MTIDVNVSREAVVETSVVGVEGIYPEHMTAAWLGVDLSMLGVQQFTECAAFDSEPFHYGKMMAAARAATGGGLDFVALSADFCASTAHPNSALDAVNVGAQLRGISGSGVVMEVKAQLIHEALDSVAVDAAGWASLAITIEQAGVPESVILALKAVKAAGVGLVLNVVSDVLPAEVLNVVAHYADMVRLRVSDPHIARGLRFGIRSAARDVGRNVPVVVDMGVVISETSSAAYERALLVSAISGCEVFDRIPRVIGTVYDVADMIERWVGLGAADGVVILPASLPTDLAALLRGVVPILSGRSGGKVKRQSLI